MRQIYLLIILLFSSSVFAQRQDFVTWWAVGVEGEIHKKFEYKVAPQLRLYQNSTEIRSIHVDFDANYSINKYIKVGGSYRLQKKNYYDEVSYIAHRYGVYTQFNYKIKKFRLKYRALYQWDYLGINTQKFGTIPHQEHRHKISATYYKKKWKLKPVLASEFFFQRKPEFVLSERKYRLTAGVTYQLTDNFKTGVYYRFQHEFFTNNPWDVHILSVKFNYSFN